MSWKVSNTLRHTGNKAVTVMSLVMAANSVSAYELHSDETTTLNLDITAFTALLTSEESYFGREGESTWQEGFIKYGVSGYTALGSGSVYGALAGISSGTWGDGDAGGNTDGSERKTSLEEAYVGWKSGDLFNALGKDGLDLSYGRQGFVVGDGFVLKNDGLSYGAPFGDDYDRGGAYYFAARQSFQQAAIARIGGEDGVRSDIAWIQSDNKGQSELEFTVANFEYITENSTFGLMYLRGLDVDQNTIFTSHLEREDMNLYSFRATGDAGIENLFLSAEYVIEDKENSATAGYGEIGYTLVDLPWSPTITYRYSRYSKDYDPMFNGFYRGYGTWFQGEVASNYAGPFNSNTKIHHLGLKFTPTESLIAGVLYFDFSNVEKDYGLGNTDGRELDLYLEWFPTPNYYVSPTVGIYEPEYSLTEGGTQTGNNDINVYAQITFGAFF